MTLGSSSTTQPMRVRIALVRQSYRADGGAERAMQSVLLALRQNPYDVTLITRRWTEVARGEGAPEHTIIRCDPWRPGRTLREWAFADATRYEIGRGRFDLVQSNERIVGCDVYRAGDGVHREWLKQRSRVQSHWQRWHSRISPYHAYVRHAERALFESDELRAVICNSKMVRNEILHHFAIDANKLHVIYNGVDTEKFHPRLSEHREAVRRELGLPISATAFIFVGSGFDRKGLRQALDSLARLSDSHLMVIGRDKRISQFQKHANKLGLSKRVHWLGVQPEVDRYYGAADALLLPTLYDPFPNVVLEAMAAGLPVVTSEKCGGAELIESGVNGYVCDALDLNAISDAMSQLTDRNVCSQMGSKARRTVEPFTIDTMRLELTQLYSELLAGRTIRYHVACE
jgi:UDP-glucose:(heptosyl)LPS alpha-1,3-glucosyltransferase